MMRFVIVLVLVACRSSSAPTAKPEACPGAYPITRGTCEPVASITECRGVCGFVLRSRGCTPVPHATIVVDKPSLAAATDDTGRFEITGLAAGHYQIRVIAEQDEGVFEFDTTTEPLTLPAPLELTFLDRTCACGGNCPN